MPELAQLPNLPAEVLARLAEHTDDIDPRSLGLTARRSGLTEARLFTATGRDIEIRKGDDGNVTVDGYATVYDTPYDVAGGPPWGWTETIAHGAASKSVAQRDDVRLLINHDGLALARTKSKTLELNSDDVGLHMRAELDAQNPKVAELVSTMQRGDIDEMSFAFKALRSEWDEDFEHRTIIEVKLYDVSIVTYPANPAAIAQLRSALPAPAPQGLSLDVARAIALTA